MKLVQKMRMIIEISRITFSEVVREKVLYNTVLCSLVMLVMSVFSTRLSFVRPERILINVGSSLVSISCLVVGLLVAGGLIAREFERRTFLVVISKPLSKTTFLIGKYLGIVSILFVNWALMTLILISFVKMFKADVTLSLWIGMFLYFLQGALMAALAMLLSSVSSTAVTVMVGTGVYMVGSNISALRLVAMGEESIFRRFLFQVVEFITPRFEMFSIGSKITYGLPVSIEYVAGCIAYTVVVVTMCLWLSSVFIQNKEL